MSGNTTKHLTQSGSDSTNFLSVTQKITLPRDTAASDLKPRDKPTHQYMGLLFLLVGQNENCKEVAATARSRVHRDISCI